MEVEPIPTKEVTFVRASYSPPNLIRLAGKDTSGTVGHGSDGANGSIIDFQPFS